MWRTWTDRILIAFQTNDTPRVWCTRRFQPHSSRSVIDITTQTKPDSDKPATLEGKCGKVQNKSSAESIMRPCASTSWKSVIISTEVLRRKQKSATQAIKHDRGRSEEASDEKLLAAYLQVRAGTRRLHVVTLSFSLSRHTPGDEGAINRYIKEHITLRWTWLTFNETLEKVARSVGHVWCNDLSTNDEFHNENVLQIKTWRVCFLF